MKIRVGILGCANIARRSLAPAFAQCPSFDLVAIASRDRSRAVAFSIPYAARACSYDELIESDDIDLIYCPLPTGLHFAYVMRCLEKGKHVLCEKSLGVTFDEVSKMVELARSRNLLLMESFQFRFHQQNLFVRKLIADGVLGEIRHLSVRFGFPPFPDGHKNIRYSKALGGGALLDAGAYTVKAATYLLGSDWAVEYASSWRNAGAEVDLGGAVTLSRPGGVAADLAYGFDNAYQCGYDIWGSKGTVRTSRAFTAPPDFAAPVILCDNQGKVVHEFRHDHFSAMLSHISKSINDRDFEREYAECLLQGHIMHEIVKKVWM